MVNTSQQIGDAIGTALLNTLATSATATYAVSHMPTAATPDGARFIRRRAPVGHQSPPRTAIGENSPGLPECGRAAGTSEEGEDR